MLLLTCHQMDDLYPGGKELNLNLKLRGLIYSQYRNESDFARSVGWSRQKINKLTNGIQQPTIDDLVVLSNSLNTSLDDIVNIFLKQKSPND